MLNERKTYLRPPITADYFAITKLFYFILSSRISALLFHIWLLVWSLLVRTCPVEWKRKYLSDNPYCHLFLALMTYNIGYMLAFCFYTIKTRILNWESIIWQTKFSDIMLLIVNTWGYTCNLLNTKHFDLLLTHDERSSNRNVYRLPYNWPMLSRKWVAMIKFIHRVHPWRCRLQIWINDFNWDSVSGDSWEENPLFDQMGIVFPVGSRPIYRIVSDSQNAVKCDTKCMMIYRFLYSCTSVHLEFISSKICV